MMKLPQVFSRTENRILSALSQLDEFCSNLQARAHSRPVPETFRTSNRENDGTNENRSHDDPHPEVNVILSQS